MEIGPLEQVERAVVCEDLFGAPAPGSDALRWLATRYRELGGAVHPDRHRGSAAEARRAHDAFVKLTRLKAEADRKIGAGTYGDRRAPAESVTVVATRSGRTYRVGDVVASGDICDLHACGAVAPSATAAGSVLFKIARSAADDDLVENEARILGRLTPAGAPDTGFLRYVPRLVDAFRAPFGGEPRRVNVVASFGAHVTLEDVRAAFPAGLDFRDVVWMYKRLLVGLGYVHRQGIVHGAILPPHVLVHPIDHGARIVDWCYAAERGERIRARVKRWSDLTAPEIARREPATAATDIYMAARVALWMLDASAPRPLTTFLATCAAPSPRRRPDDAWALHEELDTLLRKLVGRPCYRPLRVPARA